MSDGKLRGLERRWRSSGSGPDEEAWLVERLRSGDLSEDMLGLAAYCGNASARNVVLARGGVNPVVGRRWDWLVGLVRWGNGALVRGGLAAARVAEEHVRPVDPEGCYRSLLAAVELSLEGDANAVDRWRHEGSDPGALPGTIRQCDWAIRLTQLVEEARRDDLGLPMLVGFPATVLRSVVDSASRASKGNLVVGAVRRELSEWALDGEAGPGRP